MLKKETLKHIRDIELRARYLANDALAGEYHSAFRGQGIEFDEVREYVVGDDVRHIDWHVTARMNRPFIKVYKEERERTLMLLTDLSASLNFSTKLKLKRDVAAEIAAVLAFLALRNNDKVGFLGFTDQIERFLSPAKGRGHVWRIIQQILSGGANSQGTNLDLAMERTLATVKRRSMCFVLSDFNFPFRESLLSRMARKHELVCVRVLDDFELSLPAVGSWNLRDLETGEIFSLNLSSRRVRQRYSDWRKDQLESQNQQFRKLGIEWFDVDTSESPARALAQYLRLRDRKVGRARL